MSFNKDLFALRIYGLHEIITFNSEEACEPTRTINESVEVEFVFAHQIPMKNEFSFGLS